MNLWNTRALSQAVLTETLSAVAKKNYLLAASLISLLSTYLSYAFVLYTPVRALTEVILYSVAYILGLNAVFRAYQSRHNGSFVEFFLIVSVPLLLKLMILSVFLGWTVTGLSRWNSALFQHPLSIMLLYPALALSLLAGYFWRLTVYANEATSSARSEEAA